MERKKVAESITLLKLAFNGLPYKGLFFWIGLLLPNESKYNELIEKNFAKLITTDTETKEEKKSKNYYQEIFAKLATNTETKEEKSFQDYYQEILTALQFIRSKILVSQEVKTQVESIRDAIMEEVAYEKIMGQIEQNLATDKA